MESSKAPGTCRQVTEEHMHTLQCEGRLIWCAQVHEGMMEAAMYVHCNTSEAIKVPELVPRRCTRA